MCILRLRAKCALSHLILRESKQMRNVFHAIEKFGHDEDFAPMETHTFESTEAPAGSDEKLRVLAARIEAGLPLWHHDDRPDYSGLTGVVRPRD